MDHYFLYCLFVVLALKHALAQAPPTEPPLPTFGDTVQVLGQMQRTDQDFQDGLALDLFSPKARTLVVKQNLSPLPPQFVSGTTGEPWIAVTNYSYQIQFNETANDLVAKIEIPYDPEALKQLNVAEQNTYVGMLAPDGRSWVVNELQRNVHRSENNTRIIKMTSLQGEYRLLGRQAVDTANIFVQYGQGETRTFNLTGDASGSQEAEWVDGLRMKITTGSTLRVNADFRFGVDQSKLPPGTKALNPYTWVVNSSNPTQQGLRADMRIPFNREVLASMSPNGSSPATYLTIAQRSGANDTSAMFKEIDPIRQQLHDAPEGRIRVSNMTVVDGEYVMLVRDKPISPPKPVAIDAVKIV